MEQPLSAQGVRLLLMHIKVRCHLIVAMKKKKEAKEEELRSQKYQCVRQSLYGRREGLNETCQRTDDS